MLSHKLYYQLKPFIPRSIQIALRRMIIRRKRKLYEHIWPIDQKAGIPPEGWHGWPEHKRFALVLHHDVDTAKGHGKCRHLIELEEQMKFRSSFNFVPERYKVSGELRNLLVEKGFEVCVHGLKHDGKLFFSRKAFLKQAERINHYLKKWNSVGFVSPSMHQNLDWVSALEIEHDSSTFDTDPFEPQPDGMSTIFPFWVTRNPLHEFGCSESGICNSLNNPTNPSNPINPSNPSNPITSSNPDLVTHNSQLGTCNDSLTEHSTLNTQNSDNGFVELPYTLPQDFTLFILMKEKNIEIWKKKLDWIAEKGGMALLITHPDYMNGNNKIAIEEYPIKFYEEFLRYVKSEYGGQYWHPLPKEIASFWKQRMVEKAGERGNVNGNKLSRSD